MTVIAPSYDERQTHTRDCNTTLGSVLAENVRQVKKWGIQHHPDGTGNAGYVVLADEAKRLADQAHENGTLTWRHILQEEYLEALAESDPEKLAEELVQVAAVAVAWLVDLQSRG